MKDFVSTHNWSKEELEKILQIASKLKKNPKDDCLDNKSIALMFFNSSLRTRCSFEVGINQLKGHNSTLDVGSQVWNLEHSEGAVMDGKNAEHIKDASKVLSRYFDAVCLRCFPEKKSWEIDKKDPVITSFKKHLDVPLISMESAMFHPCQALADIMTIKEKIGNPKKKKFVLAWCHHPKSLPMAVPNSAAVIASQFGMDVTIMNPEGFDLSDEVLDIIKSNCEKNNSKFEIVHSDDGLANADIVYAKSWGSLKYYGQYGMEKRMKENLKHWIITAEKMAKTNKAKLMHCLPVRRNVVVSDEVLDSEDSIVYDQAENRLHAQKGLLKYMFGDIK